MIARTVFLLATLAVSTVNAFTSTNAFFRPVSSLKGAESEVAFSDLEGEKVRVGIIRTRWNDEHVTSLVDGARKALKECNVKDDNIFETSVPGAYELPLAARFLALSGTVDAIICAGVLIKGETMHFEYISDAVAKGIMNVGIQTSTPIVYGVLNCLDEDQVKSRSSGDNNHGEDWGKTAVEMALLKNEALGAGAKMGAMGFGTPTKLEDKSEEKKEKVGFF